MRATPSADYRHGGQPVREDVHNSSGLRKKEWRRVQMILHAFNSVILQRMSVRNDRCGEELDVAPLMDDPTGGAHLGKAWMTRPPSQPRWPSWNPVIRRAGHPTLEAATLKEAQ